MARGKKTGGGSRKGKQNKLTAETKEVVLDCIRGQTQYFDPTMDKIRIKNPERWAEIMVKLFNFVMPSKVDATTNGKDILLAPNIILPKED